MDNVNDYVSFVYETLLQQSKYIPQKGIGSVNGNDYIALQWFADDLKPIASSLFFSKLPGSGVNIQVISLVNDGIPADRALSVALACVTLTAEYENRHIEFRVLESPNGLQLVSNFNFTIMPTTKKITRALNRLFNTLREVQGRLSNGVLIR